MGGPKVVFFFNNFTYIFSVALDLCRVGLFSGCSQWGLPASWSAGELLTASCCRAQALGMWTSAVVVPGLSGCGSQALERRLSSCGTQA